MTGLVVCDVDKTLLMPGEDAVQPAVLDALGRLVSRGIAVAVASGRPYSDLRRLFSPLAGSLYFICLDGAVCFFGDRPLYIAPVSASAGQLSALVHSAVSMGMDAVLYAAFGTYAVSQHRQFCDALRRDMHGQLFLASSAAAAERPILKLCVHDAAASPYRRQSFLSMCGRQVHVVYARGAWIEMTGRVAGGEPVDKAYALGQLRAHLSVAPDDVVAFGDGDNDVTLLSAAGRSYAAPGASEAVRAVCDAAVASVTDALCALAGGAAPAGI